MSLIWIMGAPWFPSRYSEQHITPIILVSLAWALMSPGSWAQWTWLRSDGRTTIPDWEMPTHVRFVQGASSYRLPFCSRKFWKVQNLFPNQEGRGMKIFIHSFESHPFIFLLLQRWAPAVQILMGENVCSGWCFISHLLPLSITINIAKSWDTGGHDKGGNHKF